jgi:hypothetical protein
MEYNGLMRGLPTLEKRSIHFAPVARNCVLLLVAAFVPLALLEAGLRIWKVPLMPVSRTYVGQFRNRETPPGLMVDQALGWRLKPTLDFGLYRSNSQGFRSAREFDPSPAARKIVLVGDSFAFGVGVPEEVTFAAVVERGLHRTAVYNLGIPGFGLDQMWLTLAREGFRLHPTLVIVAFIGADFGRSLEAYRGSEGWNKAETPFVHVPLK